MPIAILPFHEAFKVVIMYKLKLLFFSLIVSSIPSLASQNAETGCLAAGCHESILSHEVIHEPSEDDCLTCHDTDSDEHPSPQGAEYVLNESVPTLCYDCHDEKNIMKNIHSPVEDGECLSCHNPHSSENESLLLAKDGNVCLDCHDLEVGAKMEHGPYSGKLCTSCHNPHQSENEYLLEKAIPQLCYNCHEEIEEMQDRKSVHPPFEEDCLDCHLPHTSPEEKLLISNIPNLCYECHDMVEVGLNKISEVHGPFQESSKCNLCHSPHATDFTPVLLQEEQSLCFKCHDKPIEIKRRVIKNIKKIVSNATTIHEPVDDGCTECHDPHTPDNNFLLTGHFPMGNYTQGKADNFSLCFDCHDSSLMEQKITTEATEFRNGSKNLHFLHVNREKARSCKTCHSVHGSTNSFLIAEKIKFGKWDMPIVFSATDNGGTCQSGCHEKKTYSR